MANTNHNPNTHAERQLEEYLARNGVPEAQQPDTFTEQTTQLPEYYGYPQAQMPYGQSYTPWPGYYQAPVLSGMPQAGAERLSPTGRDETLESLHKELREIREQSTRAADHRESSEENKKYGRTAMAIMAGVVILGGAWYVTTGHSKPSATADKNGLPSKSPLPSHHQSLTPHNSEAPISPSTSATVTTSPSASSSASPSPSESSTAEPTTSPSSEPTRHHYKAFVPEALPGTSIAAVKVQSMPVPLTEMLQYPSDPTHLWKITGATNNFKASLAGNAELAIGSIPASALTLDAQSTKLTNMTTYQLSPTDISLHLDASSYSIAAGPTIDPKNNIPFYLESLCKEAKPAKTNTYCVAVENYADLTSNNPATVSAAVNKYPDANAVITGTEAQLTDQSRTSEHADTPLTDGMSMLLASEMNAQPSLKQEVE
ncbi:MAG TPA: hypothetical protein VFH39_01150, partial [Candidatus Saccharimonadales bacterium]|nr:hypothetical protein [Candidatus Saccharimonadales bacterium]